MDGTSQMECLVKPRGNLVTLHGFLAGKFKKIIYSGCISSMNEKTQSKVILKFCKLITQQQSPMVTVSLSDT